MVLVTGSGRPALLALLCVIALLGSTGCSGSPPSPAPAIVVSDAWVQVTGGNDLPAAGYFRIDNRGDTDDTLLSASSPGATSVELHQTGPEMSGMIGMNSVASVPCSAHATVTFAPGGYHLMISGLVAQLRPGDYLELALGFARAGTIVVQAEVRRV
jgi:periplasmic copper chaperone A